MPRGSLRSVNSHINQESFPSQIFGDQSYVFAMSVGRRVMPSVARIERRVVEKEQSRAAVVPISVSPVPTTESTETVPTPESPEPTPESPETVPTPESPEPEPTAESPEPEPTAESPEPEPTAESPEPVPAPDAQEENIEVVVSEPSSPAKKSKGKGRRNKGR